jgi:hypothetical protein
MAAFAEMPGAAAALPHNSRDITIINAIFFKNKHRP